MNSFILKTGKALCVSVCLFFFQANTFGQSGINWSSQWQLVYPASALPDQQQVKMNFALTHLSDGKWIGQPSGFSWFRYSSTFSKPNASLVFNFHFKKYDGTIGSEIVSVDLSKPNESNGFGAWFGGYEILDFYDIKLNDPNKEKAENLKHQFDDAKSTFNSGISKYLNTLRTAKSSPEVTQSASSLANLQSQFNSICSSSLQSYRAGDGNKMQEQYDALQKLQTQLNTNYNLLHDLVERQMAATNNNNNTTYQTTTTTNNTSYNPPQQRQQAPPQPTYTQNTNTVNNARQQQIEEQRRQQLSILDRQMQAQSAKLEAINSGIEGIRDMFINSMLQKEINSNNAARSREFDRLRNLVDTKPGVLVNCDRCDGRGFSFCDNCNGNGYKVCSDCSGNGKIRCYRCSGTGIAFNVRCVLCNGTGASTCTTCFGKGKNVCTRCDALGKIQCIYCYGTGETFKEDN